MPTKKDADPTQPVIPFRWDLTRRKELEGYATEKFTTYPQRRGRPRRGRKPCVDVVADPAFLAPKCVRKYCARVLAMAGNADLVFVGRSLESFFDYLSGVFLDSGRRNRIHLLQFSSSGLAWQRHEPTFPTSLRSLHAYFRKMALDPTSLLERGPLAFVDIVETGGTMHSLFSILYNWCKHQGVSWRSISPKLRIVGLTGQTKTSPKTWRWQQQVSWVRDLQIAHIKNVSLPPGLYRYFGGFQPKVTSSYYPWRWGQLDAAKPEHRAENLEALRAALKLFDWGRAPEERLAFANELLLQVRVQSRWLRELVSELRECKAQPTKRSRNP